MLTNACKYFNVDVPYEPGAKGASVKPAHPLTILSRDNTRKPRKLICGFCILSTPIHNAIRHTLRLFGRVYPTIQKWFKIEKKHVDQTLKLPSREANTTRYATMILDPTMLNYRREFSMDNLQRLFVAISESWFFKLMLGACFSVNDWVFHPRHDTIIVVLAFVTLDTLTGALKALIRREFSSSGFFRCALKIPVYLILLMSGALLDRVVEMQSLFSALSIVAVFLSTTEAISILENIGGIGFPIPKKLMDVLRFAQDRFSGSTDKFQK